MWHFLIRKITASKNWTLIKGFVVFPSTNHLTYCTATLNLKLFLSFIHIYSCHIIHVDFVVFILLPFSKYISFLFYSLQESLRLLIRKGNRFQVSYWARHIRSIFIHLVTLLLGSGSWNWVRRIRWCLDENLSAVILGLGRRIALSDADYELAVVIIAFINRLSPVGHLTDIIAGLNSFLSTQLLPLRLKVVALTAERHIGVLTSYELEAVAGGSSKREGCLVMA